MRRAKGGEEKGGRSGGTPTRRVEAKRRARSRSGSRHSSQGGRALGQAEAILDQRCAPVCGCAWADSGRPRSC